MSSSTVILVVMNTARTDFAYTGERYIHATTINVPDDILLKIFDFCRKNHVPGPRYVGFPEAVWDWHILVHVCQRWRQVVFASPLRLNLRILCTYGTVRKNLDIWPTFPIQVEYPYYLPIEAIDQDNIVSALDHRDRISVLGLRLTGAELRKLVPVMQEPFPALTNLFLSMRVSNDVPVLPSEFLGRSVPRLRTISLTGIPFPALPVLLLSTRDLNTLHLFNIPQTGYIQPEAMVESLATLTRLESLYIGFQSPTSRPDQICLPVTRSDLSSLIYFTFCGVSEYLEDFVARINTPRLQQIHIDYFNQVVDLEGPQLRRFIERSERLIRRQLQSRADETYN